MGCGTAQVRAYFPELVLGRSARSVWLSLSGAAALLVCTPEQALPAVAPSVQERFLLCKQCTQSSNGVDPPLLQVFSELDQAGSLLAKDTLEDGLPVHNGKGDVRKCPYYAAEQDRGRSCPPQTPLSAWVCQRSQ